MRNKFEEIVHEYASDAASRAEEDYEMEEIYKNSGNAIWDDEDLFREYCEGAEMSDEEIDEALSFKADSSRDKI